MSHKIDRQFTCNLVTVGCPVCINEDHGSESPWWYIDEAVLADAVQQGHSLRCQKSTCGEVFLASTAILSESDPRFQRPRDDDGVLLSPMWALVSCPACMRRDGKFQWRDVWAKGFLRAHRYAMPYLCPSCRSPIMARDYLYKHGW